MTGIIDLTLRVYLECDLDPAAAETVQNAITAAIESAMAEMDEADARYVSEYRINPDTPTPTPPADLPCLVLRFSPQEWDKDHAVSVDPPEGESELFRVSLQEFCDITGFMGDDPGDFDFATHTGDALRTAHTAPEWMREHSGPFCIIYEDLLYDPE